MESVPTRTSHDPYGARRRAAGAKLRQLEEQGYLYTADYTVIQDGLWASSHPEVEENGRHEMVRSALLRAAVCRHEWTEKFSEDAEKWIAAGLMPGLNIPDAVIAWAQLCVLADRWMESTEPAPDGADLEALGLERRAVDDAIDDLVRKARG